MFWVLTLPDFEVAKLGDMHIPGSIKWWIYQILEFEIRNLDHCNLKGVIRLGYPWVCGYQISSLMWLDIFLFHVAFCLPFFLHSPATFLSSAVVLQLLNVFKLAFISRGIPLFEYTSKKYIIPNLAYLDCVNIMKYGQSGCGLCNGILLHIPLTCDRQEWLKLKA